jgi:flagellar hook-length control protein FliK
MADRIFDPGNPLHGPTAQDFDGSWHTFGSRVELDSDGNLTGGAARFPNPTPGTYRWIVYKMSDQTVVAEVDLAALAGATPGAWNSFTSANFVTPGDVALDSSEEYFVATASPGDFVYRDSSVTYPYGTGVIHAVEGGFFNGGTGPTFPDSFTSGFVFPADMLVDAAGPIPVAATGQSTAAAGATCTAAKVGKASARSTAAAATLATAAKTGNAAGTAAAALGAMSTTVKVVHVTATCTATAGITSTSAGIRRAVGTATAAASSTTAARKTALVAGTSTGLALAHKAGQDVRSVTATCHGIATTTAAPRRRRAVPRPDSGHIARPATGIITRP